MSKARGQAAAEFASPVQRLMKLLRQHEIVFTNKGNWINWQCCIGLSILGSQDYRNRRIKSLEKFPALQSFNLYMQRFC